MKKVKLILVSMFTISLIVSATSIWAYDNLCWTINGWPLKLSASPTGYVGSDLCLTINGIGTSMNTPISGTAVVPASGPIQLSFEIVAASEIQHAVVHQLTLDAETLNGTGYWRWYDSSYEGTSVATFVPCSKCEAEEEADLASQGIE
jgi:hypothetical protein